MGVQVNRPWGYYATTGVYLLGTPWGDPAADPGDPSIPDGQVRFVSRNACPIYDRASTNDQVILSHDMPSMTPLCLSRGCRMGQLTLIS